MQALAIHAGPRALAHLRREGLRPEHVRVVPAAAGGPKGLVLNALDRYLFGHWLSGTPAPVHLLGASIGAWRMAAACTRDPDAALAQLAEDYITQRYPHAPGKGPQPKVVTRMFGDKLNERFGAHVADILSQPRFRLHVFTSRGTTLLKRPGRLRTPLGWLGAFASNAASRKGLGLWLERVVFSDARTPLPFPLSDFRSATAALSAANAVPAILASCTVPFWLDPVQDIPGAPRGAYWDGGITDYHLHLPYNRMDGGIVLYPHFGSQVVPGWLDKSWKGRHRSTHFLDNLLLLAPRPQWVATLPGGKLPDRSDFQRHVDDDDTRERLWRVALAESRRLADEFASVVNGMTLGRLPDVLPLA
ncbi:MAG: patatin-like phospholipase family protein [Rubrivivax sp.]|jgi:hypothetical protein